MSAAYPSRYPLVQRVLHWAVFALIVLQFPGGWIIEGYEKESIDAVNAALGEGGFDMVYDLHKSVGLTILGLMILRAVVRAVRGSPDYARPIAGWARLASGAVHLALYALLIVTPIVGWWGVSAYPAPVPWFFLFEMPLPVAENRELSETLLQNVHGTLAMLILILIAVHVLAALKHRFIDRDEVFGRMVS